MKIVLLSGGSGKRLWPLSSDSRSKQFLKILPGEAAEQYESMVQRILRQLHTVGLKDNVFITASAGQIEILQQQLGDQVQFIVEPERKDTLPAICLSVLYLNEQQLVSSDEVVIVLPVDSYVNEALFLKLAELEQSLRKAEADIALIGVEPTYPSAKYGYIIPESSSENQSYRKVTHFVEKPSEQKAEKLIGEGALWNCGIFAFQCSYLLEKMQERGMTTQYHSFFDDYAQLQAQSFDYEILEKADHIITATYKGYWKDLGTWNTLTEEIADSFIGKGKMSADCSNTHVINELGVPIYVLGISDAVVAASPEGIIVTDKVSSPRLKELLGDFRQRPMYEEKSWGHYKVIDHTVREDQEYTISKFKIFKDHQLPTSYLYSIFKQGHTTMRLTILSGQGTLVAEQHSESLHTGITVELDYSSINFIKALTELEFMIVSISDTHEYKN